MRLPDGDEAPRDGRLPAAAVAQAAGEPISVYVHVPFCATRCGYCDFNTYTAPELGGDLTADYLASAHAEIDLAARVLGPVAGVDTVFFGGGTPTLLPAAALVGLLRHVDDAFGLAPDAEVTTEANPETVTPEVLSALRDGGFNRMSLGMQSSAPGVLATLERRHTPGQAVRAAGWAGDAGFERVSLDLIYGTPGETMGEWEDSVAAALGAGVGHVSAYALIIEDGTRMAARMRRGELPRPSDDDQADKYLRADAAFAAEGMVPYELSNWARPGHECRHNLAYWRGRPWWGIGPGAHSHVGGVRWWNVKHPRAYAERFAAGASPAAAREELDAETRRTERVLLEVRLAEGLPWDVLTAAERSRAATLIAEGLLLDDPVAARLTLRGRLLADAVVRDLLR